MGNAVLMQGSKHADAITRREAVLNVAPMRVGDGTNVSTDPGFAFKPGTVLGNNTTTKVRVRIAAFTTFYVLVKLSARTGTLTVNGYPMLANASDDDTVGTRKTIGLPTALSITSTTAQEMAYTCKGEEYFEIECVVSNGGSDSATIEYIEVYGT